jgi:phage gp16-like protein
MSSSTAAIHVAKKQLGLDDETYRAKLTVITGKSSTKDMSEDERQKVLAALRRDGFKPIGRRQDGRQKLEGKYARKMQALWIAAWNLGLVNNRDDAALIAFVKRQTGIEHTRWLIYADDANKVVEGLKAWIKREAGVLFGNTNGYDWLAGDGAKIAWAQWQILNPGAGLMVRKGFDEAVLNQCPGVGNLSHMTPGNWQEVGRAFGLRIRAAKAKM